VTVLDTSGVVDFLLGEEATADVERLLDQGPVAAPDLLVFEVLAVLRRLTHRGDIDAGRASAAVDDLGDFPVELFPSLPMRRRAFALRESLTAADALFVVLADVLDEPLATKDSGLAATARRLVGVEVVVIPEPGSRR
jgi:predicted nucleic acid-binding protein